MKHLCKTFASTKLLLVLILTTVLGATLVLADNLVIIQLNSGDSSKDNQTYGAIEGEIRAYDWWNDCNGITDGYNVEHITANSIEEANELAAE